MLFVGVGQGKGSGSVPVAWNWVAASESSRLRVVKARVPLAGKSHWTAACKWLLRV